MCGRFALGLPRNQIRRVHGHRDLDVHEWVDEEQFVPRYNIAPHSRAPVLRRRDGGEGSGRGLMLHTMRWGVIPHWAKFEDKNLNTINARSENLVQGGGMWGSIKGKKRCVVLAQGYYEWQKKGKDRIPYFTKHKDDKLMLLAGLYDCVVLEGEKDPLWTFTIVTTLANSDFDWLHERQPVILTSHQAIDTWLDTSSQNWTDELTKLVEPYHDKSSPLECYQVPKEVGKVGNESQTFIEPVAKRKDGIQAMFLRMKDSPPKKRKRSPSPPASSSAQGSQDIGQTNDDHDSSLSKKPKRDTEGVAPQELLHEVNVVEVTPPPEPASKHTKSPKKNEPKKSPKKPDTSQRNKITTFFAKA